MPLHFTHSPFASVASMPIEFPSVDSIAGSGLLLNHGVHSRYARCPVDSRFHRQVLLLIRLLPYLRSKPSRYPCGTKQFVAIKTMQSASMRSAALWNLNRNQPT
jgi:hypothetical protein